MLYKNTNKIDRKLIKSEVNGFMIKNKQLYDKVKYLYYDKDMSQKDIAEMLGLTRQWISVILNSSEKHEDLMKKKKQKRNIERKVEFYKNSVAKISIPNSMLEAIGIDENNRDVKIKVVNNKIIIEKI